MADLKKYISVAVSGIAVTISVATLYITSLRPANITSSLGERMEFQHTDDGLFIRLPIVLRNTGAKVGVISSLGVILKDRNTENAIFLKWTAFLKLNELDAQNYIWESFSTPFPVPAGGEVTKMVEFYGGGDFLGWVLEPTIYDVYLLAWTSEGKILSNKRPSSWTVNKSDVSEFKQKYYKWIIRSAFGPDSKKLSPSDFNELVKQ
jgi:hypothetical protein